MTTQRDVLDKLLSSTAIPEPGRVESTGDGALQFALMGTKFGKNVAKALLETEFRDESSLHDFIDRAYEHVAQRVTELRASGGASDVQVRRFVDAFHKVFDAVLTERQKRPDLKFTDLQFDLSYRV